jgi:8-oxo-dGTP pyrophosphatase MutT (NUDIX family)
MRTSTDYPRLTVAAVIEHDARFLLVEERLEGDALLRLNQPAGHVEVGESLIAAAARETLEESGHAFTPRALVGVYHVRADNGVTYVRFAFAGDARAPRTPATLDREIVRTVWLTRAELAAEQARHRSPLVLACVDDFLRGQRFPLDVIRSWF